MVQSQLDWRVSRHRNELTETHLQSIHRHGSAILDRRSRVAAVRYPMPFFKKRNCYTDKIHEATPNMIVPDIKEEMHQGSVDLLMSNLAQL